MPRKVRELRADLRKGGFKLSRTRGSHTTWEHPDVADSITVSGGDSDDAKPYQEKQVREALKKVETAKQKKKDA